MSWPVHWQQVTPLTRLARPLAALYEHLAAGRRGRQTAAQQSLPVPVIVVGNIVVGGSGKTPMIAWLAEHLCRCGLRPGIISRGHGGRRRGPHLLAPADTADNVGDEPLQLSRQTGLPVCIGRDRPAAARHLLACQPQVNVLISDDGLQHYRLPRSLELCLFDGGSGIGNGELIPAGPLREPLQRLDEIDMVICKGRAVTALNPWKPLVMQLALGKPEALPGSQAAPGNVPTPANQTEPALALCGIGQPESFFALLRQQGWSIEPLALPDHGMPGRRQIAAMAGRTVLMTSKDAVKLARQALPCDAYEVPLEVNFDADDRRRLDALLASLYGRPARNSEATVQPDP